MLPQSRHPMLRIEYAYWLLAAFFFAAAWMNLRERRWAASAFWTVLGLLFAGGDFALSAKQGGDGRPVQLAGICVVALAVLAPLVHRPVLFERPHDERLA